VAGGWKALYVPDMLAHAVVQPERLTIKYHRQWHANIGRCNARMGFEEIVDPILGLVSLELPWHPRARRARRRAGAAARIAKREPVLD
jgi:hypothetical protein